MHYFLDCTVFYCIFLSFSHLHALKIIKNIVVCVFFTFFLVLNVLGQNVICTVFLAFCKSAALSGSKLYPFCTENGQKSYQEKLL